MFAGEFFSDVDAGCLACAFKVEEGSTVGKWIGDGDVGAVPAVAAIVRGVGIAGVVGIEAVRDGDGLPDGDFFGVPEPPMDRRACPGGTPTLR